MFHLFSYTLLLLKLQLGLNFEKNSSFNTEYSFSFSNTSSVTFAFELEPNELHPAGLSQALSREQSDDEKAKECGGNTHNSHSFPSICPALSLRLSNNSYTTVTPLSEIPQ